MSTLSGALIGSRPGAVAYETPTVGRFVSGWDVAPSVDGELLQLDGYSLVDGPWT